MHDVDAGRTLLVSRASGAAGAKGDDYSHDPAIDAAGTRVAFVSGAANLGDGDTNPDADAHLRDLATDTTTLVSTVAGGPKQNGNTSSVSIDAAGARVTFASTATNLLGITSTNRKVFVRDLGTGDLLLASRADGIDGAVPDNGAYGNQISADGRYVAFVSDAENLGAASRGYRRDIVAGRTTIVSRGTGAAATEFDAVGDVTADGACVAFTSESSLLGARVDAAQAYLRAFAADCGRPVPAVAAPAVPAPAPVRTPALRDTTAPVLRGARLSRERFRVARGSTALSAATGRGTVLTFRASEAATLTVLLERRVPGRRASRKRCIAVRKRPRRGACVAYRRRAR